MSDLGPSTTARPSAGKGISAELLITAAGLLTSVAVVAINLFVTNALNFDFLSFSLWLVVPAGAIIGGMAAASGYYLGARGTQTLPARAMLLNMVAIAVSTWLLSKWLVYYTMPFEDGRRVSDLMGFWQYFKIATESTQLTISSSGSVNSATTSELGALGYVREGVQLLGFMAGGLATYFHLSDVEACPDCQRYAKSDAVLREVTPQAFDDLLNEVRIQLPGVGDQAMQKLGGKPLLSMMLYLCRCPQCGRQWLRPAIVARMGSGGAVKKLGRYDVSDEAANAIRGSRDFYGG